jgi:aminopeptidase N
VTTAASTTAPTTAPAAPSPGAEGVGDDLYPTAGNGGYDVAAYDIALTWHPKPGTIDAVTTITATATQALSQFDLDLSGLSVASVVVGDAPATFDRHGTELVVHLAAPIDHGATFVTRVTYSGEPGPDQTGGWFRDAHGGVIVFGEPQGAAGWYPVNDHPSDKATYTVHVTAPSTLTVAANGDLVDRTATGTTTTWTYADRFPQASYLTTIAIGDYQIVDGGTSASGVKIRNVFPTKRVAELTKAFADQPKMIDQFEQWFGPYPFDVYGGLVIDGFDPGGALETQTMSVFGSNSAEGSVIPHELAHQWFGDSVSLERWHDIWLNEGFATYAEDLWAEATTPGLDLTAVIKRQLEHASAADVRALDQPITDVNGTETGLFTTSVYQRGALLLHALRVQIGDDAFRTLLHRWASEHAQGNGTTEQFVALADEVAGRPLDDFFDRWLHADPMPNDLGTLPAKG